MNPKNANAPDHNSQAGRRSASVATIAPTALSVTDHGNAGNTRTAAKLRLAGQQRIAASLERERTAVMTTTDVDSEIELCRERWARVLAQHPTIAEAWAAWRSAGNPPAGLAAIAEAAIAVRVPWADGQDFDPEPWRAWASGQSTCTPQPEAIVASIRDVDSATKEARPK